MTEFRAKRRALYMLLGAALVLGTPSRSPASPYHITVLNGNGYFLGGLHLNNLGQIAGAVGAGGTNAPFFYDPTAGGKVTFLGLTTPGDGQTPFVDGTYLNTGFSGPNDFGLAVVNSNVGTQIYNSRTGQVTPVAAPSGEFTNTGQIVGDVVLGVPNHAALHEIASYQNGSLEYISPPPGSYGAWIVAANDQGQILVRTDGYFNASLLNQGNWTNLGDILPVGLNNQGTVLGAREFIPLGGPVTEIGTLPGSKESSANGINDEGAIVGSSGSGTTPWLDHGYLLQSGVMTDLNALIDPKSGWRITSGLSINDRGQIIAAGEKGDTNALLLLTPDGLPAPPDPVYPNITGTLPEPSTMVVFGFLAAALAFRAYSRNRHQRDLTPGRPGAETSLALRLHE